MSKKLKLAVLLFFLAAALLFAYANYFVSHRSVGELRQVLYVPGTSAEYPKLAEEISGKINELSPTRSFDEIGWIAVHIAFVAEQALAYVEYTDTHVALRLLIQYGRAQEGLVTKVLATFIPKETGGWELQYGRDAAAGLPVITYRYNGDAKQWIPML